MRALTALFFIVIMGFLLLAGTTVSVVAPSNAFAEVGDEDFEPDAIVLDIHLAENGSGEWTIEHRYRLADEADETAFADLADDITENESAYIDRFNDRMEPTLDAAIAATNRDMSFANVAIETETRALPQEYGIVRYTFEWHEFATDADGEISAGDAIGGLFLDDASVLRMAWSDSYELTEVSPTPDEEGDQSVLWRGPKEFDHDEPQLNLEQVDDAQLVSDSGIWLILAGIILVFGLLLAGWMFRTRSQTKDKKADGPPPDSDALLSNEERVLRLLAEEGGRMKQQEIVTSLGWTDAKTSQVISDMRESGTVESFRLGRENVVSVPDTDNDSA